MHSYPYKVDEGFGHEINPPFPSRAVALPTGLDVSVSVDVGLPVASCALAPETTLVAAPETTMTAHPAQGVAAVTSLVTTTYVNI